MFHDETLMRNLNKVVPNLALFILRARESTTRQKNNLIFDENPREIIPHFHNDSCN